MIDFSSLFSQLFSNLWWLFALLTLASLFKSPWFKGFIGEVVVNIGVRLFLNKNDYHLIKNVTIPTDDGTTQIDHIIVSRFGLFVVETKNMKGWIFGSEHQKQWMQQIFKSKTRFQNPLHQNYKHTRTLETALELSPEKLISGVVFIGDSTFKTDMPENVTEGGGYIRFIKSKTDILLTESEVQQVIQQIADGRLKPSIKTHREHAKHVREIVAAKTETKTAPEPSSVSASTKSESAQSPANKSCPKCGSDMVMRMGKKGPQAGNQFWGCSTFPRCRTIAEVEQASAT